MKVKDPVCGMVIDPAQAAGQIEAAGRTHYFCSPGCRQAFSTAPDRYNGSVQEDIQEVVSFHNLASLIFRLIRIIQTVLREFWALRRFMRLSSEERVAQPHVPQRFVKALLDLGPTFIKLGQILSTRPDLLPGEYIAALGILHERVPPFAYVDVEATLRQAFGKDIRQVFHFFAAEPVAAASLSQAHFAVLPDGREVAVKVQRPQVRQMINRDMIILSWLIGLLRRLFPRRVQRLNLVEGFNEFRRYTLHELDFSLEGATLERFQANFQGWEDIVFPAVCWDYTSPKVLTMSRVAGLRLGEAMEAFSPEERNRLNRRIMELEMKMFIADGFFHADLHPGNIFFRQDGKIVILDVGMVGELTGSQRDRFMLYMLAVAQKQTRRAFYHLVKQTQVLPWADEEGFYRKFKELADAFYAATLSQVSLAQVYLGIILHGSRFGFIFPSDLLLHAKAITTAEALAFTLAPDLNFAEAIQPIIARELCQRAFDGRHLQRRAEQILPELILIGEIPPAEAQDDYRDDVMPHFLWSTAAKVLSTKLNEFEQGAGLMKAIVNPYAWQVLTDHYPDAQVKEILERTWMRYLDLEPSIPHQKTFGARFTVHAAAAIIALYEVLTATGQTKDGAAHLIYQIAWEVYTVMGDLPWFIGGTFTQDGLRRLKLATDAFRSFPFGSPAYLWQDVDAGDGVVAFDCLRCPVAEYFASHNLSELCVKTFCNLDFPLAEQWGAKLERTGTLASGAPRCDFRWRYRPLPGPPGNLYSLDKIAVKERTENDD